jgi:hypothetical protein
MEPKSGVYERCVPLGGEMAGFRSMIRKTPWPNEIQSCFHHNFCLTKLQNCCTKLESINLATWTLISLRFLFFALSHFSPFLQSANSDQAESNECGLVLKKWKEDTFSYKEFSGLHTMPNVSLANPKYGLLAKVVSLVS